MLMLQVAAAAETLLVRNMPPVRTTFESIAFVASGLTSILALLLIAVVLASLLALRTKADQLIDRLDALLVELRPMTRTATVMAEDVREVARNVNGMVSDSRETVRVANERVRASVVNLTDRVDDLSAIISRVNESAESVATVATTTMAGIKFGARALGLTKPKKRKAGRDRPRLRKRD